MIPKELEKKYSLADISEYDSPTTYYKTFLIVTDFIPNKILEGASTSDEYKEELYYREIARQKIDKLNGGTGEILEARPLDKVAAQNEANIDFIAMMTDVEL